VACSVWLGASGDVRFLWHYRSRFSRMFGLLGRHRPCPIRSPLWVAKQSTGTRRKFPLAPSGKSPLEARASLCPIKRDVSRSSRTLGKGCDGRVGAAGRAARSRTAKSCGLDASTLASTRADATHHAGMVARKPITRESAKEAVKTNRAGKAGMFSATCGDLSACFFICTRSCGCVKHPAFPAPSVFGGTRFGKARAIMSRECGRVA
jgi:hypothetical protein